MAAPRTPRELSEIAPGVFVGSRRDAEAFDGARICVLEESPPEWPRTERIPIYDPESDRADPAALDRVAAAVTTARTRGDPVMIFCGQGVRRSPLAAAWYLHRAHGLTLDAAYDRIRAVRPQVEPVQGWAGNAAELRRR